ncbi:helix-turn-helix domain-containing protein [Flavicella sediminum]|uniref:helix-turn-helix domain-containing protein n=1 Tax=Flavicella sediminum TaxID=2585141 RepID=UPI00112367A6|nr:helix-turn-helix transcriptional regulator [Flavicella sediminum]
MLNNLNFSTRLKKVIEYYGISASAFADVIEVPRSSISHILSGRNKPSLDFVLKITHKYNEVDLYWLLDGKGSFPKNNFTPTQETKQNIPQPKKVDQVEMSFESKNKNEPPLFANSEIDKVLIFYKDGTFKEYKNRD